MPFWKFFGGVFAGKALAKVSAQAFILITIFSKDHREDLLGVVEWLMPVRFSFLDKYLPEKYRVPPAELLHHLINDKIRDFQEGLAKREAAAAANTSSWLQRMFASVSSWDDMQSTLLSMVPSPWSAVTGVMLMGFLVSCIHQLAQQHAAETDREHLEKVAKAN